jgi:hypothetical protein
MPPQDQWRLRSSNATAVPPRPTIPIAQRRARLGPVRSGAPACRADHRQPRRGPAWRGIGGQGAGGAGIDEFVRTGQAFRRHEAAPSGASRWLRGTAPLRRSRTTVQSGKLQRVYTSSRICPTGSTLPHRCGSGQGPDGVRCDERLDERGPGVVEPRSTTPQCGDLRVADVPLAIGGEVRTAAECIGDHCSAHIADHPKPRTCHPCWAGTFGTFRGAGRSGKLGIQTA